MRASEIKQLLTERAGYRGERRLWQIHDLRAAGLDYPTARFVAENPDFIDFICGESREESSARH